MATSIRVGDENGESAQSVTKVNIALVVLMGLPASGKTSLGRKIELECTHRKTAVIQISYDHFIPHDVQAKCALLSENNVAKLLRKNFIQCVEILVAELRKCDEDIISSIDDLEHSLPPSPETENLVSNKSFISNVDNILKDIREKLQETRDVIFLIDDNNYYSSMRNEFYQIAKTHRTGFSILYCKTSVQTCRKRNSDREAKFQVPDKTIVEMSLKLEQPNPMGSACDSFCLEINDSSEGADVEQDNIPLIIEVLHCSLKQPIDWTPPPDRTEEINRERRICSENEIHQADQVLRKWVNKELAFSSLMKSKDANTKREISRNLNQKKRLVLDKLRSGEFRLFFGVERDLEFTEEVIKLAMCVTLE